MTLPELPASIDSEKAVLGSLLLNREAIIAVADQLKPEYFHMERHAWIYEAILACYQARTPPDTRTVAEELRRRERLEMIGGIAYLSDLVDGVPTSYHVAYYTDAVLRSAVRRRVLDALGKLGALAYNESIDVASMLEQAHALLDGAAIALHDPRYSPFRADLLDQEDLPPMTWAIPGLLPQGLTLLIGKPKMRKSWLALAIGIAVASGGRALGSIPVDAGDVLYLALEDSKRRLQGRQRKILGGTSAPERLYYMTVAPRLDEGLVATVETWLRRRKQPRLVIVDVLAKVRPKTTGRGNMYDEDYSAIGPLQELAQRRGIAVLVVHHMNKGTESTDVYDLINGSSGVGGAADGLLGLQYERGQQDATLTISSRELEDEAALALHWDNTTAQWILIGKADEVKASNERQEILRLLREEKRPMTPREVADALGKEGRDYQNVKTLMYRMAKDGDLQNANGRYTVPELTLIGPDENRNATSGDPVIGGDRGAITENRVSRSDTEATNVTFWPSGDRGDRNPTRQNLDHRDHRDHRDGFSSSESESGGDPSPDHRDHRSADLDWNYARQLHKAGNLKALHAHCTMRHHDYDAVLRQLGDMP